MKLIHLFFFSAAIAGGCATQNYHRETLPWQVNYDEAALPPVELPEILTCSDGRVISSPEDWNRLRRPELLRLFQDTMYGKSLPLPARTEYRILSEKRGDLNGTATRREILITFHHNGQTHDMTILFYVPERRNGKVPLFAGLNFRGNHSLRPEPEILPTGLRKCKNETELQEWLDTRASRRAGFPVEEIIRRGYAVATASYHDLFPDRIDGWQESIFRLFFPQANLQPRLPGYSSIGAWAWGISRIIDCAVTFPEIDAGKIACYGHSRLGKTSLWAGVNDERIGLICVNDSGCGGAALSRRLYGETLYGMYHYNNFGKYWFTDTLESRALHPETLPVDQHMLIALAAPRAIAVHSATEDRWADPKGEYLAAYHAGPVYRLFGKDPLESPVPPIPDMPVGTDVSYFLRTGKHALLPADWLHYLDRADYVFGK